MKAYPQPTDHVFPGNHITLFNSLLERTKLKFDRDGKPRTAYNLRHAYICVRLMEGAEIYQIAKNCRTSVEMIEKTMRIISKIRSTRPLEEDNLSSMPLGLSNHCFIL